MSSEDHKYTVRADNGVYFCPTPMKEGCKIFSGELIGALGVKEEVAFKVIEVADNAHILREIVNMKDVRDNSYIVQYRKSGEFSYRGLPSVYIVMDKCGPNLEEIIQKQPDYQDSLKVLNNMIQGISHIHDHGILHRNLTPFNVLRSKDSSCIKVAGFGISKKKHQNKSQVSKSGTTIGKEGWGSPEHYEEDATMSVKSDIFSAGLIFCYVLSGGTHPCGDDPDDRKETIKSGIIELTGLKCPDEEIARDLISKMLEREPSHRPTAEEVLKHPFFWDCKKKLDFLHEVSRYHKTNTDIQQKMKEVQSTSAADIMGENWLDSLALKQEERDEKPGLYEKGPMYKKALERKGKDPQKYQYNHESLSHLIRFMRNVEEHYQECGPQMRLLIQDLYRDLWKFFSPRFPKLLCHIFHKMENIQELKHYYAIAPRVVLPELSATPVPAIFVKKP